MPTLRIALAQDNPVVGDLDHNAELIRRAASAATAAGAHLLATGEQALTGYPVEDLALRHSFVEASRDRLVKLAAELAEDGNGALPIAVGYLDADGPMDSTTGHGIRNALALIQDGKVLFRYYKHHLPNYGVFDEDRYFVAGHELHLARIGGVDVAFTVCEDVWGGTPFTVAAEAGAGFVVNINASPYEQGKHERRLAVVKQRAAEIGAPVAYLNTVGGQDDLVFDGGTIICGPDGRILASARRFTSELLITDVECAASAGGDVANHSSSLMSTSLHVLSEVPAAVETRIDPSFAPDLDRLEEVWEALRLGLADYVNKNGFPSVRPRALGRHRLGRDRGFRRRTRSAPTASTPSSIPSQYSTRALARRRRRPGAQRCGIAPRVEPIQPIVDAYLSELAAPGWPWRTSRPACAASSGCPCPTSTGTSCSPPATRASAPWATRRSTATRCGGFAPIKDVLKTLVCELAHWRNEKAPQPRRDRADPRELILKPPSAELRPDQLDTDSLPDYAVLDGILVGYVDGDAGREDLVEPGYPADVVERIAPAGRRAEYKRRQSAPGTKITVKSFGRDRRLPITNRFRGKSSRGSSRATRGGTPVIRHSKRFAG